MSAAEEILVEQELRAFRDVETLAYELDRAVVLGQAPTREQLTKWLLLACRIEDAIDAAILTFDAAPRPYCRPGRRRSIDAKR